MLWYLTSSNKFSHNFCKVEAYDSWGNPAKDKEKWGPFSHRSSYRSTRWVNGARTICKMLPDRAYPVSCQHLCFQRITCFLLTKAIMIWPLPGLGKPKYSKTTSYQPASELPGGRYRLLPAAATSLVPKWRQSENRRKAWDTSSTWGFQPQPREPQSACEVPQCWGWGGRGRPGPV